MPAAPDFQRRPRRVVALPTRLANLLVLVCLASIPAKSAPASIHLNDAENYSKGQYGAYASPWAASLDKSLVHGVDYVDTIEVDPRAFPDRTVISWRWPARVSRKSGVWGYMHVFLANYDGGATPIALPPRQVSALHILSENFDLAYSVPSDFNLLNEFYLTSKAGDAAAKVTEVAYFLHVSSQGKAFFEQARPIGSYRDEKGRVWRIRVAGRYCMLIPADGNDVLNGAIDIKATLVFLRSEGLITGDEWFNGIAMGSEPIRDAGRLELRRWEIHHD